MIAVVVCIVCLYAEEATPHNASCFHTCFVAMLLYPCCNTMKPSYNSPACRMEHNTCWVWIDDSAAACIGTFLSLHIDCELDAAEVRPYFISWRPQEVRSDSWRLLDGVERIWSTYADAGGSQRTNIARAMRDANHTERAIVGASGQTERLPCPPPSRDSAVLALPHTPRHALPSCPSNRVHRNSLHCRHLKSQDHLTRLSMTLHPTIERSEERFVFTLNLRRAEGFTFGVIIRRIDPETNVDDGIIVSEIDPESTVGSWNKACLQNSHLLEKVVRPGDKITSVNCISQNWRAMLLECINATAYHLTVERPRSVAMLRAEATEFNLLSLTHEFAGGSFTHNLPPIDEPYQ